MHYIFAGTKNCDIIHGVLYSCLRALFGISVIGILVCIFSCMLVYQIQRYVNPDDPCCIMSSHAVSICTIF